MEINALRYGCGHIAATKEIPENEFVVYDPTLILPGKCPVCSNINRAINQAIRIAHSLPETYFKGRKTLPITICNSNEKGLLIWQDLKENQTDIEDAVKKIAEAEDQYLQQNNAKQIGITEDLTISETPMPDGTRKRMLYERIKAIPYDSKGTTKEKVQP